MSAPALAAALAACAPGGLRYAAPDLSSRLPRSVAVLPFDNETVSLRGPDLVRRAVAQAVAARGFEGPDAAAVDEALAGLGVTDGGQLRGLDPARLGAALGAPALLFGTLEEFTYQNVGFVRRRAVRVALRLVDAPSGERLWEAVGEEARGRWAFGKDEAGRSFVDGVVEQAVETALGVPLAEETRRAVEEALSRLPGRSQ